MAVLSVSSVDRKVHNDSATRDLNSPNTATVEPRFNELIRGKTTKMYVISRDG